MIPAIAALSAIYFVRLILWNSFGKEIITFEKDKLSYVSDYRYFKDGKQEIKDHLGLHIHIIESKQSKGKLATLHFASMDEKVECVSTLSLETCQQIKKLLVENAYLSTT